MMRNLLFEYPVQKEELCHEEVVMRGVVGWVVRNFGPGMDRWDALEDERDGRGVQRAESYGLCQRG